MIKEEEINALVSAIDTPPEKPSQDADGDWYPDLNKTQKKIFEDPSKFLLAYGEKGSGKTMGLLYKLVRHCYENQNALALVVSPSIRTGKEGVLHDLETLVLPKWKEGMGLEYTSAKLDPNTKDRHLWIGNRFNGWSKVLLVSIPYKEAVEARIKGMSPSFIYVDELTNCNGREYFTYPAAQLNRRSNIEGPQQYTASCNPEGPSNWVYKVFFEDVLDEETGESDKDFGVYHVPISENTHRLPETYLKSLEQILKHNPVERRRLILGEWIDKPSGEALFREYYSPEVHKRGNAVTGKGLLPVKGHPIIVGYDLGQVFSAVTFLQSIPTKDGAIWTVFDEVDYLGEKILYKNLVREITGRMDYWSRRLDHDFKFHHISDESAINQWHPGGEGSYDAWDVERYSEGRIKLVGCPKGKGSVEARVRLLANKLVADEFYVSDTCRNTVEMLHQLTGDRQNPSKPKRSRYIHKFDSITYPMFRMELSGKKYLSVQEVRPNLIKCGVD
tara:strand:- start:7127 stop:8632 length:1506 start_codon:yes stop_codon:yes gene_type:complete